MKAFALSLLASIATTCIVSVKDVVDVITIDETSLEVPGMEVLWHV